MTEAVGGDDVPQAPLNGRRRAPFEAKVIGLCLVATISALTFAFGAFLWQDWQADRADLAADQITLARLIAPEAAIYAAYGDVVSLSVLNAMTRSNEHTTDVAWFSASGQRLELSTPTSSDRQLQPSGGSRPSAQFGHSSVVTHLPYFANGRRLGEVVLRAEDDEINAVMMRNSIVTLGLAVVATLIAGLVAKYLARRSLRPLYALDRGIEAVRRSRDFGDQVKVSSNDEFGSLTENFNAMLSDLKAYQDERRGVQELTAARDAAEAANVLKSQFLANMSHEIRTPLNGVLGMAQVMATGRLGAEQRERLGVIQASSVALLSILDDILDLSKIEAERLELEDEPFAIEDVAGGACATFASVASTKGLAFTLEISERASGQWRGDALRVRQLIHNLVSNALKFTSHGEVRVCIDAGSGEPPSGLTISVSDTGIGVAPEDLPKLFEKFVQVDSSTTRRFGGSGLGLTICRHMVELMGGVIDARSTLGEGTTFSIVLPLAWLGVLEQVKAEPAEAEPAADLSTLRVLAADDNETNRLVLKAVLHAMGVIALIVEDGRSAVDAWQAGDFDLILMDIQMPVLDGVGATREIRRIEAEKGLPRTPIVAVTANAMKHQVDEYLVAGLDAHIPKPLSVPALHAVLAQVASDRPAIAALAGESGVPAQGAPVSISA